VVGNYPVTDSISFLLEVTVNCLEESLVVPPTLETTQYTLKDSLLPIDVTFSASPTCSPFSYHAAMLDGSDLPSFLTFDETIGELSV